MCASAFSACGRGEARGHSCCDEKFQTPEGRYTRTSPFNGPRRVRCRHPASKLTEGISVSHSTQPWLLSGRGNAFLPCCMAVSLRWSLAAVFTSLEVKGEAYKNGYKMGSCPSPSPGAQAPASSAPPCDVHPALEYPAFPVEAQVTAKSSGHCSFPPYLSSSTGAF